MDKNHTEERDATLRTPVRGRGFEEAVEAVATAPADMYPVVVKRSDGFIAGSHPSAIVELSSPGNPFESLDPGLWIGFVCYENGYAFESVTDGPTLEIPYAWFGRYDDVAYFDSASRFAPLHEPVSDGGGVAWDSSMDSHEWRAACELVREHLVAGDCYQMNLTRKLSCLAPCSPIDLALSIARTHPAVHAAYIATPRLQIVSASPETFLASDGHTVSTHPIKGTHEEAAALEASVKDAAENVMIVDMARNDLGRVCDEVHVDELLELQYHPGLVHLVSKVVGTIRDGVSPAEVFAACFPAASITGAPKPRVMQIIADIEAQPRGVYCGAIGYVDTRDNSMEFSVAIRTFVFDSGRVSFGAGGGITIASDPQSEFSETELKARALSECLARAARVQPRR